MPLKPELLWGIIFRTKSSDIPKLGCSSEANLGSLSAKRLVKMLWCQHVSPWGPNFKSYAVLCLFLLHSLTLLVRLFTPVIIVWRIGLLNQFIWSFTIKHNIFSYSTFWVFFSRNSFFNMDSIMDSIVAKL